jgi:hypothetical protein
MEIYSLGYVISIFIKIVAWRIFKYSVEVLFIYLKIHEMIHICSRLDLKINIEPV